MCVCLCVRVCVCVCVCLFGRVSRAIRCFRARLYFVIRLRWNVCETLAKSLISPSWRGLCTAAVLLMETASDLHVLGHAIRFLRVKDQVIPPNFFVSMHMTTGACVRTLSNKQTITHKHTPTPNHTHKHTISQSQRDEQNKTKQNKTRQNKQVCKQAKQAHTNKRLHACACAGERATARVYVQCDQHVPYHWCESRAKDNMA